MTEPTTTITSEQGLELGRPSALYVEVHSRGEEVTGVRVGGRVVAVAEGEVRFELVPWPLPRCTESC